MSVFEEVRDIICEQLDARPADIKPETSFVEDLGADSLDTVELAMSMEERYNINIPDEDLEKITTVSDVVKYIEGRLEALP